MSARYFSSALEVEKTEFCGFVYMHSDQEKKHSGWGCLKKCVSPWSKQIHKEIFDIRAEIKFPLLN